LKFNDFVKETIKFAAIEEAIHWAKSELSGIWDIVSNLFGEATENGKAKLT